MHFPPFLLQYRLEFLGFAYLVPVELQLRMRCKSVP